MNFSHFRQTRGASAFPALAPIFLCLLAACGADSSGSGDDISTDLSDSSVDGDVADDTALDSVDVDATPDAPDTDVAPDLGEDTDVGDSAEDLVPDDASDGSGADAEIGDDTAELDDDAAEEVADTVEVEDVEADDTAPDTEDAEEVNDVEEVNDADAEEELPDPDASDDAVEDVSPDVPTNSCEALGGICLGDSASCEAGNGTLAEAGDGGCLFDDGSGACCIPPVAKASGDTCEDHGGLCAPISGCNFTHGNFAPPSCGAFFLICCVPQSICGEETQLCCDESASFRPACDRGAFMCTIDGTELRPEDECP